MFITNIIKKIEIRLKIFCIFEFMEKKQIEKLIDNKIIENFLNGFKMCDVKSELQFKSDKFQHFSETDLKLTFDEILKLNWEEIRPTRIKYYVFYTVHCRKRLKDFDWIIKNKNKFRELTYLQVFNLLRLKEKLSEENAVVEVL